MFLKVGQYILNTDAIASVNLESVKESDWSAKGIRITLTSTEAVAIGENVVTHSQSLFFQKDTPEYDALLKFFSTPDTVADLLPDSDSMQIESKIQAELERLRQQAVEKELVAQRMAEQKQRVIVQKQLEILTLLRQAGVTDESVVRFWNQAFENCQKLGLTVTISGVEIEIKSDSQIYCVDGRWVWTNPVNDHYMVNSVNCRSAAEIERVLIRSVSAELFKKEETTECV